MNSTIPNDQFLVSFLYKKMSRVMHRTYLRQENKVRETSAGKWKRRMKIHVRTEQELWWSYFWKHKVEERWKENKRGR